MIDFDRQEISLRKRKRKWTAVGYISDPSVVFSHRDIDREISRLDSAHGEGKPVVWSIFMMSWRSVVLKGHRGAIHLSKVRLCGRNGMRNGLGEKALKCRETFVIKKALFIELSVYSRIYIEGTIDIV